MLKFIVAACLSAVIVMSSEAKADGRKLPMPARAVHSPKPFVECDLAEWQRNGKIPPVLPPPSTPVDASAKGKIIFGGGGWDTSYYLKPFAEEAIRTYGAEGRPKNFFVLINSAGAYDPAKKTVNPSSANAGYNIWGRTVLEGKIPAIRAVTTGPEPSQTITYRENFPTRYEERVENGSEYLIETPKIPEGVTPLPTYEGSTNPDDERSIEAIRRAHRLVIDGGFLDGTDSLPGTGVAKAVKAMYERGGTILTSSAGTNIAGLWNASRLWPNANDNVAPELADGMGLVPFGVSSHINSQRLMASLGFGEMGPSVTENGKKTTAFKATNPYAFLDPLHHLYTTKPAPRAPYFGVPDRAKMVYEKGIATFESGKKDDKFFIFDPRVYALKNECDLFYVKPGTRYNLTTGETSAAVPEVSLLGSDNNGTALDSRWLKTH